MAGRPARTLLVTTSEVMRPRSWKRADVSVIVRVQLGAARRGVKERG